MGIRVSVFHAWRSWKSAKSTAALAVVALALGIGSASAIYTVVRTVLLNPLPYVDPDRYLAVEGRWRGLGNLESAWSYPNCVDFAARATTLDAFGCASFRHYSYVPHSEPIHAAGVQVSPELVRSFGVKPLIGRWFSSSPNDLHTVVISEALWKRTGSAPAIAGKSVVINAIPYKVSGVAPAWFRFPIGWGVVDLWMPLDPTPSDKTTRENKNMLAFAKKKAGASDGQVLADLTRIASELEREHPEIEKNHTVAIKPLLGKAVEYVRPSLLLLLGAAGALLAIACGNVASLLLARAVARARETALRVALGATAGQLALQYIAEGVLVAIAGAAVGVGLSFTLVKVVLSLAADRIPRGEQVSIDRYALAFALAIAIVCGILFSLAPLWQALRTSPNQVLTSGVRTTASRGSLRLLRIFVVTEIALSFALLTIAAIFLRHLGLLFQVKPGFEPNGVSVFSLYVPPAKYNSDAARLQYQSRLLEAMRGQAGIKSAGFTSDTPLSGSYSDILAIPDHRNIGTLSISEAFVKLYDYQFRVVSDGYFAALKIPLVKGEGFDSVTPVVTRRPVLIDETVARKLWPRQNPVGHVLSLGDDKNDYRVIGVVGDVREMLSAPAPGHVYVSYRSIWPVNFTMWWLLRSNLPLEAITREVRAAIATVDPQQSITQVQPMTNLVKWSVGREELESTIVSFFGVAALVLAMLGVYGVMSYSVRQRIPEMGTRFALGATSNRLTGMVLSDAAQTAAMGILIGVALVFGCVGVLSALGISAISPEPFLVSFALIAVCTLISAALPSWFAGTLDPIRAVADVPESVRRGYGQLRRTISALTSDSASVYQAAEVALLADVAEKSRHADSFNDAIGAALATVTEKLESPGAALLVRRSADQPFRLLSSSPGSSFNGSLPVNSLLVNRLAHYYPAIPITETDLQVLQRWAEEKAAGHAEEIATLKAIGPATAVPVSVKEEIVGVLFVAPPMGRAAFDGSEMRLLRSVGAQLALMVENSRLTDRIVEQERLKRDLALASEVQQRLFPEQPPEVRSARLSGLCLPARGVGGDYYDFLRLNDHQIGIALADVAGKGVAAALVMSVIQASLRSLAGTDGDAPATLAGKMNRLLCGSTGPSSYATFFYAKFDETERRLYYVNGGHNPPFLLRSHDTQAIEELAAGGMIIGMFPQSAFVEAHVDLHDGDVFMAFTDGVSEAHNQAQEEFGEERLKELLRTYAHLPVDQMSEKILRELRNWMADAPQHDDLTFILMKLG